MMPYLFAASLLLVGLAPIIHNWTNRIGRERQPSGDWAMSLPCPHNLRFGIPVNPGISWWRRADLGRWTCDNIAALVIIPPAFVVMVVMDLSGRLSLSSTKL